MVALQGAQYLPGASLLDTGTVLNAGLLELGGSLASSATFTIGTGGTLINSGTLTGAGVLLNNGLIGSGGQNVTGGVIAVASLVNDGTVQLAPFGALAIASTVTAVPADTGQFLLTAQSHLTLGAAVDASQRVDIKGTGVTLTLGSPTLFLATIEDLRPVTTIDFRGLDITAATETATDLTLVTATGAPLDIPLITPTLNTHLHLASDGAGGTLLTIAAPLPHANTATPLLLHLPN